MTLTKRPTPLVIAAELLALAGAIVFAILAEGDAQWDLALLATLTGLSIVSDLIAVETRASRVMVSASLMTIVLGAVLLGGPPAALMGVVTMLIGWGKARYELHYLLANVVTYAWFPLIAGIAFHEAADATTTDPGTFGRLLRILG